MALACTLLAGCADGFPKIVVKLGEGDTTAAEVSRPFVIATDDTEATENAERILRAGGSAGDAAAAAALVLAVTLPSSAGLGARGACLVHNAESGATTALDFTAPATQGLTAMDLTPLERALLTLHGTLGALPWAKVVAPAANLARFGHAVSATLAARLGRAETLLNDGAALAVFMSPRRQLLSAGEILRQPGLAAALDRLRGLPRGGALASVLPWSAAARTGGGAVTRFTLPSAATGTAPADGATSFVVGDAKGNAVACALSMGQAFGRGAMVDGVLVAGDQIAALNPAIVVDGKGRVVAATASAGRPGAAWVNMFSCVPDNARLDNNRLGKDRLDNGRPQCEAKADPRGGGYARAGKPGAP